MLAAGIAGLKTLGTALLPEVINYGANMLKGYSMRTLGQTESK
jgi:hypothetical protein